MHLEEVVDETARATARVEELLERFFLALSQNPELPPEVNVEAGIALDSLRGGE